MRNNEPIMQSRLEVFKLFGIPVRIDYSWFFIVLLITYILASGYFPGYLPGYSPLAYWGMGFVGAIAMFASILFHELSHALVARYYQIKIDGITLFIFGGVAQMEDEASSPKAEFLMAGIGPLASMLLAAVFYSLNYALALVDGNPGLMLLFDYLFSMNAILAIFNLVPAFPLDGGRLFRAVLWAIQKNYHRSTVIATRVGQGFAWLLIGFGAFRMLRGAWLVGIWSIFIGFFLKKAGESTLVQLEMKRVLESVPVADMMNPRILSFHPQDRLIAVGSDLGEEISTTHFPIVDGERLVGYLSLLELEKLPLETWEEGKVADYLKNDIADLKISPDANAWQALQRMRGKRVGNLFVSLGDRLLGVVTIDALFAHFQRETARRPEG